MTPTEMLAYVTNKMTEGVPLVGHMQLKLAHWRPGRVEVEAPLVPNMNSHGTAFGGSLYCVANIAGWALMHLSLMDAGHFPSVWIAEGAIKYHRPVRGTLRAVATLSTENIENLVTQFAQQGKAKMAVEIVIEEAGSTCVTLSARYAAVITDPI